MCRRGKAAALPGFRTSSPNTRINQTWAQLSYSKRWGCEEPEQRNQLDQPQSTRREVLDLGPGKGLSPAYQLEGVTDTGTEWSCCCPSPCCDVATEKTRTFGPHRLQGAWTGAGRAVHSAAVHPGVSRTLAPSALIFLGFAIPHVRVGGDTAEHRELCTVLCRDPRGNRV